MISLQLPKLWTCFQRRNVALMILGNKGSAEETKIRPMAGLQ